ncbi:MAG TPA: BamA/TamA family outer membrane protein [Longimicrobiales bacterium]|nr:BamA/TamA family outer membrane protein [Longimicrobiales bacterium]
MSRTCVAMVALVLTSLAPGAGAQERTVVPGPDYGASGFARFWLGDGWRSLWLTPVRAPVLDLGEFAGGLTPERQGGGNQSITLHMLDADGVGWVFRSIDKYPEQGLPPELDGSFLGDLVADQISSLNPASHFILPRLLEAAGILHLEPQLYVMPDDPRLGEFRETFAGMLGEIELKPNEGPDDTPGFAGSTKIKDVDKVFEDIEETRAYRVDAEEFLRARLIDMWVGDPDRGSDQWRFARFGEEGDQVYRPIPRDRDWAFVHADGFLTARFRSFYPKLVEFHETMPEIVPLTYSSHVLDRRLLTAMTRADFAEAARAVQQAMTDAVIDEALASMPREFVPVAADEMRSKLIARRAELPALADRFYDWLATDVDVRGTDEDNLALVERHEDGSVRVRLSQVDAAVASGSDGAETRGPAAWYDRTFLPEETDEVRIYLHGGDDRAVITGPGRGSIKVRVIGGGDDDVVEDETGTVRFYDHRGDNQARGAASFSTKEWEEPEAPEGLRFGKQWAPDYGSERSLFSPAIQYGEGAGLIIGGGPTYTDYGFRRIPYRSRLGFNVLYGTSSGGWGAELRGEHRLENSRLALTLNARAVEFDAFRFYGFGNDTPDLGDDESLVMMDRVTVFPALTWDIGPRPGAPSAESDSDAENGEEDEDDADEVERAFVLDGQHGLSGSFSIGPFAHWTRTRMPAGNPLPAADGNEFGRLGGQAILQLSNTDQGAAPRRGYRMFLQAAGFPAAWDAEEAFGTALAQLSGYLPLFGSTHLAARVGGEAALGEVPLPDAASIGGRMSVRGYRFDRYTGDAATWGNLELRIPIDTVNFIVNGELGVFGLADAGRVWMDGESPGGWHTAWGGGVWFSAFDRAVSVAWARGDHSHGRFYVWQGLPF